MSSAAIARDADAEVLAAGSSRIRLLLDASDTDGVVTSHRVRLVDGAAGAPPHRHTRSSEIFFVLEGVADLLVGDDVVQATAGDLVVVNPGVPHAFKAAAGHDVDLLVLVTPGVERFPFYREVARIMAGTSVPAVLAGTDERYDNHAVDSKAWGALMRPRTSDSGAIERSNIRRAVSPSHV